MTEAPHRFYRSASTTETDGGFGVDLDNRPLRTPARALFVLPSLSLAEAVAEEWRAQGETLDLPSMRLTRLANVALDRTPETRADLTEEVARYLETDLVCHLADGPEDLRARQEAEWGAVRRWAGEQLGIVLVPVEGVVATPQPSQSLDSARAHGAGLDDFRLTGLVHACGVFGSAVLALALERGHLTAKTAFLLSVLDETFQAELWGEDAEATAARGARAEDAEALGVWFASL